MLSLGAECTAFLESLLVGIYSAKVQFASSFGSFTLLDFRSKTVYLSVLKTRETFHNILARHSSECV